MTIGDVFIIPNEFTKKEIGLVLIFKDKNLLKFLPIFFENDTFDYKLDSIFNSKILTNIVHSGPNFVKQTGVFLIDEFINNSSFLKSFIDDNMRFTTVNIDFEKIDLQNKSNDFTKITSGSGTSFPKEKNIFDRSYYHLFNTVDFAKTDFRTILKTET